MQDIIPTLLAIAFFVFCYDQKVIASLQRQGKYDPDTHQTVMSRMFFVPFKLLLSRNLPALLQPSRNITTWKTEGDLSEFSYNTTVCMNKLGKKVRLSHFFDDSQHAWYKIEKINGSGIPVESPRFEPASVTFDVKKLQYL